MTDAALACRRVDVDVQKEVRDTSSGRQLRVKNFLNRLLGLELVGHSLHPTYQEDVMNLAAVVCALLRTHAPCPPPTPPFFLRVQDKQECLYRFFQTVLQHVVTVAKRDGTFDEGIIEMKGTPSLRLPPRLC